MSQKINPYLHTSIALVFILNENFLTHLSRMEFPTLINWTCLFQLYGLFDGIFHFYSNFNRKLCKQTVESLGKMQLADV